MAIIYADKFSTTLQSDVFDTDTTITLTVADATALQAAFGMPAEFDEWNKGRVGAAFVRLPLIIDNGTAMELLDATGADASTGVITVTRSTPAEWASGTTVRCAPPAGPIAAGHRAERPAVTGAVAFAVPGERVPWIPGASDTALTLKTGRNSGWPVNEQLHFGDTWTAEIIVANANVARTLTFYDFDGVFSVNLSHSSGLVSSLDLPDTCAVAILRVTKLPIPVRSVPFLGVSVTVTMEIYG